MITEVSHENSFFIASVTVMEYIYTRFIASSMQLFLANLKKEMEESPGVDERSEAQLLVDTHDNASKQ